MKFGSLFSGIGGFDIGLERAGMECVWQVEIDDYATRILEKHWPKVKKYRDVRECGKHNLEPVDIICGGFPCQPHSLAGKRKGSADERDLWGEFARIIRELRPRYVVAENVPGLLSSESGRFFGRVLRDLAESGYDAEWRIISAKDTGAPHLRERVWIIAYTNGERRWLQSLNSELKTTANFNDYGTKEFMADSNSIGFQGENLLQQRGIGIVRESETIPNSNSERCKEQWWSKSIMSKFSEFKRSDWWEAEPNVGRVVNGLPNRVDRLKCLGNSVVPQIVEWIGRKIILGSTTIGAQGGVV